MTIRAEAASYGAMDIRRLDAFIDLIMTAQTQVIDLITDELLMLTCMHIVAIRTHSLLKREVNILIIQVLFELCMASIAEGNNASLYIAFCIRTLCMTGNEHSNYQRTENTDHLPGHHMIV